MKRQKENKSQRIVIFVEGDTDEVFFKALSEYYKSVSRTELVPCDVSDSLYQQTVGKTQK